jgi:acyl-CoA synthetase (AMP-forming)/AMP-acid ligase II
MNTLAYVLNQHVAAQPNATFLIAPETKRVLSYGEFARAVDELHEQFQTLGIGVGAHVGFFLPNGLATSTIFLGTMILGRVVVPFNLLSKGDALAATVAHSRVQVIFADATTAKTLAASAPSVRCVVIDVDDPSFGGIQRARASAQIAADTPALLMYTSGTTGAPKGAMLTHANLMYVGRTVGAWHGLTAHDRVLSSLPLYHINGQCIATIAPFVSGGSIIAPRKFSVNAWWGWVHAHAPTWLNVVPTIIAYLLNAPAGDQERFSGIRFARSASAPLPPDQQRAFETRFGIGVIEAMGMTECASMVFCNPQDFARRKIGSPGLPCGVEAKVIDPDGRDLPENAPGELCLRGPNVMQAYFDAPEKTKEAFDVHGWLRTGDIGFRDADGFYFVTGRIKELIIKGGENIAPREIDEALLQHPAVLEAAAYAVADPNYGQDIHAAVVVKPEFAASVGQTLGEELKAHAENLIGPFKMPKKILFHSELPKGPSGKVQRLKLGTPRTP